MADQSATPDEPEKTVVDGEQPFGLFGSMTTHGEAEVIKASEGGNASENDEESA